MAASTLRQGWSRLGHPTSRTLLAPPHGLRTGAAVAVAPSPVAEAIACRAEPAAAPLAARSSWLHAAAAASYPPVRTGGAGTGGQATLGVQRPWLGFAGDGACAARGAAASAAAQRAGAAQGEKPIPVSTTETPTRINGCVFVCAAEH